MNRQNQVVTVTINPAIDQTLFIPGFTAGAVNRVQSARMDAGGKGINVAAFLADYGQPVLAAGFLGAENDEIFRQLFERKGIEDRCIRIAGKTRIGLKIIDEALGQTTDINFPGEAPSPEDLRRLMDLLAELAADHEWFVLSGSIPRGVSPAVYAEMVRTLAGRKVVLDTSGEGFGLALQAGPWMIKPNTDELSEYTGKPAGGPLEIARQARLLQREFNIHCVVVSMGKEGAVFAEGEEIVWAAPPPVEVKSTVGAGDAMAAGMVAAKIRGLSLAGCARLATAFSAAAVGRIGAGLPSAEAVEKAGDGVTLREIQIGMI